MKTNLFPVMVFFALTVVNLVVSWRSLRAPRSHGYYRFFAWEFMSALIALNIMKWFFHPLVWHQLISWLLLILAIIPVVAGVHALKTGGKQVAQREGEPQLLAFEKTSQLITSGIYRYIRHPLYSSLLFLTWGIFFKSLTWPGLALAVLVSFCLVLTARADEHECIDYFGGPYQEYMKRTKRFIPFIL
jgi:protein-S-isoprenylcysteine O-methyltransferase Ste14